MAEEKKKKTHPETAVAVLAGHDAFMSEGHWF